MWLVSECRKCSGLTASPQEGKLLLCPEVQGRLDVPESLLARAQVLAKAQEEWEHMPALLLQTFLTGSLPLYCR